MAEKASVKVKSGDKSVKVKGPSAFVKSVVGRFQENGMPNPNRFRYRAAGEK